METQLPAMKFDSLWKGDRGPGGKALRALTSVHQLLSLLGKFLVSFFGQRLSGHTARDCVHLNMHMLQSAWTYVSSCPQMLSPTY